MEDPLHILCVSYYTPFHGIRIFASPDPRKNIVRATSVRGYSDIEEIVILTVVDSETDVLQRVSDPHALFDYIVNVFGTSKRTSQVM